MIHPAQRVCSSATHLYYAVGQVIFEYDIEAAKVEEVWRATPLTAAEKEKNLENRAIIEMELDQQTLVWISEDKFLRVYDLEKGEMLNERELVKRGCALSIDKDVIVVGDKFGDVYHYGRDDTTQSDGNGKETKAEQLPIIGHVSMLTSVLLTRSGPDEKRLIISADRDEHIRVSNFPNGHNIEAYCLGHTQFISTLCILEQTTTLVSAGGDEYLAFWDYTTGKQIRTMEMTDAVAHAQQRGVGFAVLKVLEIPERRCLAVLVEGVDQVFLYPTDSASSSPVQVVSLASPALDMTRVGSRLVVTYDTARPTADQGNAVNFDAFDLSSSGTPERFPLGALNAASRREVDKVEYTTHRADLMRKRTKTELEALRLAAAAKQSKRDRDEPEDAEGGVDDDDDDEREEPVVDEALQRAIDADKILTEQVTKRAKAS